MVVKVSGGTENSEGAVRLLQPIVGELTLCVTECSCRAGIVQVSTTEGFALDQCGPSAGKKGHNANGHPSSPHFGEAHRGMTAPPHIHHVRFGGAH